MSTALRLVAAAAASALFFSKVLDLAEQNHSITQIASTKQVAGSGTDRQGRFAAHGNGTPQQPGHALPVPCQEYFLNKQGLYIHFRRWIPLALVHPNPVGVVVLVHGLGEHIARYAHVAQALNQAGFVVYGLDHQGHGRSEGDRLHVDSFSSYVDDVLLLVELAKREQPLLASKVFLFGHSMGGLITIHTLQRTAADTGLFRGAVISGPPLLLEASPPAPVLSLLAALSAFLPKLPVDGLPLDTLADNKPMVDLYLNDPLVSRGKVPARLLHEMVGGLAEVRAELIALPYFLFHGQGDKICLMRGSEDFHAKTQSKDKTFAKVAGGHETLNEVDGGSKVIKLVVDWLKARVV